MREQPEFRAMSEAVERWYSFYEVRPDEQSSQVLCTAAVRLYNEGLRSVDDISTALIGTYVGIWSTEINASTSAAVH